MSSEDNASEPELGAAIAGRNKRRAGGKLMSQAVFQRLEEEILERVRPPGSRLIEDVIAEEFGVSRTPVREALRMLHRAGWLDLQPHTGAYVRRPGLDEVRDVFDLREVLERESARFAANRATPADKERLRDVVERGFEAKARKGFRELIRLNEEFHETLADASGNAILRHFLEELAKQVRWHFSAVVTARANASWDEHLEILEAIERSDDAAAARCAAEHTRRTHEAYIEQFLAGGLQRDPSIPL
jgi:DNA-binding GntR family transcriptional regulator